MSSGLITEPEDNKISLSDFESLRLFLNQKKWFMFAGLFFLVLLGLVGIIIYIEVYMGSFDIRVDCNPDLPLNYEICQKRGCIWVQRTNEYQPPCFFPDGYGYHLKQKRSTSNGYNLDLQRTPEKTVFGNEVNSLNLQVYFDTPQRLRLKFVDSAQARFEVPMETPPPPAVSPEVMDYIIDFVDEPQFGVIVKRNSTGTVLFDTNVPGMIFSNQYIQISTKLPSSNIYGLGEHASSEYRHSTNWKRWSFFARGATPNTDSNSYGVHPFYMNVETDGNAHGVFLLNSNAMEIILQPKPALTYRCIGGILDFYIFLGPTPEDIVKQYLSIIGFPLMPPYWALGFQLSRFGYQNMENVKDVVQRTIDAGIPYDVQYFDIDIMDGYRDFTLDPKQYQILPEFVADLHKKNLKVFIALDPTIASNKSLLSHYAALNAGIQREVFIKIGASNGTLLEGKVWPGKAYFIDFSSSHAEAYWSNMCFEYRKLVLFDGLWIDMNEPSNFVDGSLTGCEHNSLNYPPYAAGILGSKKDGKLFEKTICMDAIQSAGKHYDTHNLYGFFQARVTFRTLSKLISQRPMVISRSTFPGSGRYAGHWLGDNLSTWSQMRNSIPGILEFSLFGIPYSGANICGFLLNATQALCLRWMQLGAFYPFSRNHNSNAAKDQDPSAFGKEFVESIRRTVLTRYELLPYLYTLFHLAHTEGSTVARPLLHEFPADENTWDINSEFLWGPALLISPILHDNTDFVDAYFPRGIWYNFYSGEVVKEGEGKFVTLIDRGNINLHVRGGYIIPLQKPNITTTQSREQGFGLLVAPDENGNASGLFFWDDGISAYDTQTHKVYLFLDLKLQQVGKKLKLYSTVINDGYVHSSSLQLEYIILCSQSSPSGIVINEWNVEKSKWNFNKQTKVLHLEPLEIQLTKSFDMVIVYQ